VRCTDRCDDGSARGGSGDSGWGRCGWNSERLAEGAGGGGFALDVAEIDKPL
jgi:hypothetical protein